MPACSGDVASLLPAALILLAVACADPVPPTPPPASSQAPTGAPDERRELSAEAPDEHGAPAEEPRATVQVASIGAEDVSYPAVSRGRTIRLASTLESGVREVGGRPVPTVAHPDPRVRAALDGRLEALPGPCRVELALERLVSLACAGAEPGGIASVGVLLAIAEDGSVALLPGLSLFHEGVDTAQLLRRLQYDPAGAVGPFVVTETGIELRFDERHVARFSWRVTAPLLRPDTALGEALAAERVPLAPVGVPFPPEPPSTTAFWADDASFLLHAWWHLPDALRAQARLARPGAPQRQAALLFPPRMAPERVVTTRAAPHPAYLVDPMAAIAVARTTEPVELRWRIGDPTDVFFRRPAGTIVPAVRGLIDGTDSELGPREWTFVGAGGSAGWVPGHSLEVVPAECARLAPGSSAEQVEERGLFQSAGARYAWFGHGGALSGSPRTLAIHERNGCDVGALVRRVRFQHDDVLQELHFVGTRPHGGRTLVVMRFDARRGSRVVVVDLASEDPVLTTDRDVEEVAVGAARGPAGAHGYFPLRVRTRSTTTWYRWTGRALEAVAP